MKTIRILGLAAAVAAVVFLPSTLPASAQPIPKAHYTGKITGCDVPPCGCDEPPCGTVEFGVSEDGSKVQTFTARNVSGYVPDVPGDVCVFWGPWSYLGDLAIVGNSFGPGTLDWFVVNGSFPSQGSAGGTLRLTIGQPPQCDTGVLNWTASSAVGGIAVLPDVSGSSAANYIPLAGVAAAALVALAAGRRHARGRHLP